MGKNIPQFIELPIRGMDCAECAGHVRDALRSVDGVGNAEVYLSAERAKVELSGSDIDVELLREAVRRAGYSSPAEDDDDSEQSTSAHARQLASTVLTVFGLVFGVVLLVVVGGEWLGLLDAVSDRIPWWAGLAAVLLGGFPVFSNVLRNLLRGKVISHSLMTLGVIAAVVVGEWITAAIVVLFMRIGDFSERFTTEKSREAVKGLEKLAPATAVKISSTSAPDGAAVETEETVSVGTLRAGELVLVRPGERLPVDGTVLRGEASIDQSTITGESVPVDVSEGDSVYAATLVATGSLRVTVGATGSDSTYGKVVRLAEEAEANRGEVQRVADKFSTIYLPIVVAIAAATYLIGGDPLATAAVLVVACSCSFALATPIAMMASIGASARQGLLVKGGKHIEVLPRATVLLIDKTGTVTTGRMNVSSIRSDAAMPVEEILRLAAGAERDSQHPVARAIVREAERRRVIVPTALDFRSVHGQGVSATVDGRAVEVRKASSVASRVVVGDAAAGAVGRNASDAVATSGGGRDPDAGKTALQVVVDGQSAGVIFVADALREGARAALDDVRTLGIRRIELLTGDNEEVGKRIAGELGIDYRANLLPEQKIAIVREYQAAGEVVIMVGDGVNDAPALVQADVGIAMGAIGSDIAIEAAHVCLLREDWALVPGLLRMARRTMRVVHTNIALTAVYNLAGLSLAAFGFLPPVLAAAAQSIPDIGILANSSRLLRHEVGAQTPTRRSSRRR